MRRRYVVAAVAAAVALSGGVAYAAIPNSSTGVYTVCMPNTGALRTALFIDKQAGTTCPSNYTEKSWNQTGPAGPAGPAGAVGPAGADGAKGDKGDIGAAGSTVTYYSLQSDPQAVNLTLAVGVYCHDGDYATGGGYEWVNAPAGTSVTSSNPLFHSDGGPPVGWYAVAQESTHTANHNFMVDVVCAHVTP